MNSITLDIFKNFFTFQNVMIILLVIVSIYLLIKTSQNNNKREDFYTDNINTEALNNLGKISEMIMKNDTLVIPASNTNIMGNLTVNGENNITPKGAVILYDVIPVNENVSQVPKGWATCTGNYAYMDKEGNTIYENYNDYMTTTSNNIDKKGYILTPSFPQVTSRVNKHNYYYIIKL